jgi:hypothetical protein
MIRLPGLKIAYLISAADERRPARIFQPPVYAEKHGSFFFTELFLSSNHQARLFRQAGISPVS